MFGPYINCRKWNENDASLSAKNKFDVKRLFIKESGDLGQRAGSNELCDLEEFT